MINGVLTPAYGRDYKSQKEVQADFNAGKDFLLNTPTGSTYINKEQFPAHQRTIQARYAKNVKVMMLKVN